MELFFKSERDKDLFRVYEKIQKETKGYLSVCKIAELAILHEAESYYITKKQILEIIQKLRCNPDYVPTIKQQLYKDIFKRYWELKKENPCLKTYAIAKLIETEKAPRFYVGVKHATSLFYKLLKCSTSQLQSL